MIISFLCCCLSQINIYYAGFILIILIFRISDIFNPDFKNYEYNYQIVMNTSRPAFEI